MPAALSRNEYYWEKDRLVQRINERASRYGRWKQIGIGRELVAAIENRRGSKRVKIGSAYTPSRLAHAILREERLSPNPASLELAFAVPQELIRIAAGVVGSAVKEVTRQFSSLSNEERRTGAITFALNRYGVIEFEGWELTIALEGFSAQTKEPRTGADLGIIVDLRKGDVQVSKGLWAQAKEAEQLPPDPLKLQDLKDQMRDMLERTKEAYAIVYTPNDIHVFQGWASDSITSLESVITDTVACRRGDRRPEFLADTVYRDFLIELAFRNLDVPSPSHSWVME
jgi:hypothetical protein